MADQAFDEPQSASDHGMDAPVPSVPAKPHPLTVMFLLDGSGSLSEIDFDVMRSFVKVSMCWVVAALDDNYL